MKRNKFFSLICLMLAAMMLCSAAFAEGEENRVEGGTVIFGSNDSFTEFFTPYIQGTLVGYGWPCYQPLAYHGRGEDGNGYDPCLAESWERNNEEHSLTLHLVKNACFSDGTPFTADDVVFTLGSRKTYNNDSAIGSPVSIEKIDDYTVKVTWADFSLSYESWILTQFMFSKKAFDENGLDWMLNNMMGTGPYVLSEFIPDVSLTFDRNPNYWGDEKASPDHYKFLYMPDSTTMLAAFLSGEIDRFSSSDPDVVNQVMVAGFEPIALRQTADAQYYAIPLSVDENDPLYKVEVRKAIFEHGIDWQSIAVGLGGSVGYHTDAIGMRGMSYYDASLEQSSFDLDLAKKELADAGYANGFKTTIYTAAPFATAATVLQASLKKLGIEAECVFVDYSLIASDYIQAKATKSGICITATFFPNTPQMDRFVKHINPNGTYGASTTWDEEISALWQKAASAQSQEEEDEALLAYVNHYVHEGCWYWSMYSTTTFVFNQSWYHETAKAALGGASDPTQIWTTR